MNDMVFGVGQNLADLESERGMKPLQRRSIVAINEGGNEGWARRRCIGHTHPLFNYD
jgi:hypothetical protein